MGVFLFFFSILTALALPTSVYSQAKSNPIDIIIGEPDFSNLPVGSGEIPSARPDDYRQALISEFGITMNGFSSDNYLWAWEFMHKVSNTRFPGYVAGTQVGVDNSGSWMSGCKSIFLRSTYNTRDLFTIVFAHELGHVVYHCSEGGSSVRRKAHLDALAAEGPLTPYSTNLCYYSSPGAYERETENFAELIAYYLNPNITAQTGCGSGPNPYSGGANPLQYQVAREILGG